MGQEKDLKYTFWCHFNRMFSETHQKSAEARDALSTDEHLDVSNPFPKTNLSSVNVDGVEVGCHRALSMKEAYEGAALGEPEGDITKAVWEDLPGPPYQCITAANTHTPMETRSPEVRLISWPDHGVLKQKPDSDLQSHSPKVCRSSLSSPSMSTPLWPLLENSTVCRISHTYYEWGYPKSQIECSEFPTTSMLPTSLSWQWCSSVRD